MGQKQWNPEVVKMSEVLISKAEFEQRLAEVVKILYDHYCQRPKLSQVHHLGMIQQVQEIELQRTGTDG